MPLKIQVGVRLTIWPSISTTDVGEPGVTRAPLIGRPWRLQKKPRVVPGGTFALTVAVARAVPAGWGAVPQTFSPWTVCGPSAGRLLPAWNVSTAWACAWVSKTTPCEPLTAFQTTVSPGLTGTLAAG